jgi:hypothetical protein
MKTPSSTLAKAFLGLIWVTAITIGYFVTHKPIDLGFVLRLGEITVSLVSGFVIVLAAAGIGSRLTCRVELNTPTGAFTQLALGTGILGIAMLALGVTIGVIGWINWAVLIVIAILFRKDIQRWWSSWKTMNTYSQQAGLFEKLIVISLVLAALITLSNALAPPVKYDALVYHLVFPKIYNDAGKISFLPNFFWGMPQLGEMLYTLAVSLSGLKSAAVLGWSLNWFAVLGMLSFAAELHGERPAWVTVVALLCGYSFLASMPAAYVDWMALFFGLATLVTLQKWNDTNSNLYLILAGCFTGFAMGCKYSAGVLFIAGDAVIFLKKRSQGLPYLFRYAIFALISFSPWVVKNLLATGNPLYPFFFPAGVVDQMRLEFYRIPPERSWQDAILLPFRATFIGIEGGPGYGATIGPLLLALSPLGLLRKNRDFRLSEQVYWVFMIVGLLAWIIAAQISGFLIQTRLYYGIFPGIAVTAGLGYKQISGLRVGSVRAGNVVGALIILVMTLTLIQISVQTVQSGVGDYLTGKFNQTEFLEQNLGWYARAMGGIDDLPDSASVLMLWEPRSLYCLPKCVADEVIDRWKHDRTKGNEADRILEGWRSKGYSHLLYYKLGAEFVRYEDKRYLPDDWETLDVLLSSLPPPVDFGGAYYLYRLNP